MKTKILALCLALFFSGCTGKSSKPITISWWQFWTDPETKPIVERLVTDFEKQHPDIEVEVTDLTWSEGHTKIVIALAAGSGPDLVELGSDWLPEFIVNNALLDLTDQVADLNSKLLRWEPAIYKERIYGVPWLLGTRVLFYNQDLLRNAGFSRPPTHWNELLAQVEKMNAPDKGVYGFGANAFERHRLYKKFLPFLWSNNGAIFADDGRTCLLNSAEAVQALNYYIKLCDHALIATQRELDDAFQAGRIGFVISGDWLLKKLRATPPVFSYGVSRMPGPDNPKGKSISFAGGEYLVVNKKCPYPESVLTLVRFITSKESELLFCRAAQLANPANREAAGDSLFQSDRYWKVFSDQIESAQFAPSHPKWVYIEEIIERAVEQAMFHKKTPQESLNEATQSINKLLATP